MKHFRTRMLFGLAALTVLGQIPATATELQVIRYPFPQDLPVSSRFSVTVDKQPVFTHAAEVADFAMFAIRGPVQVTVACEQPVTSAIVRPLSRKIVPQWEAKTVRFPLEGHRTEERRATAHEHPGTARRGGAGHPGPQR